jgi:hypothetical protein
LSAVDVERLLEERRERAVTVKALAVPVFLELQIRSGLLVSKVETSREYPRWF